MKPILIGAVLACLTACGTPSVEQVSWKPQDGLLDVCLGMPLSTPPETNGELAEAFLTAREGHLACRGVVQSIKDAP